MTVERKVALGKVGLISRVTARLVRSGSELQTRDLQEDPGHLDGTPIAELVDRSEASVRGVLRSVTLQPRANVSALVAEIYDGSQTPNLIWPGRRRIGGVVPGIHLSARGRVTYRHGFATIFNPAYEIRPESGY
jgi:hypothetical protein